MQLLVTALPFPFFPSQTATEKMAHALAERSCELQLLRQHLLGKEPLRTQSAGTSLLKQDKQPLQVSVLCFLFFFACGSREVCHRMVVLKVGLGKKLPGGG